MNEFRFEVWPTEYRKITQHFGANPDYYNNFNLPGHEGVDIRARAGSRIVSVSAGRVSRVRTNPSGHNYGVHVRVDHQDGYSTTYAHLSKALVELDQTVEAGAVIGLAGDTGNSFGAHLHLTLKKAGAHFKNYPYNIIDPTPSLLPLLGWSLPAGPTVVGWLRTTSFYRSGGLGQVHVDGAMLWTGRKTGHLVPGGTIIEASDTEREVYTLVHVALSALGLPVEEEEIEPDLLPQPTISTVDGWAWVNGMHLNGTRAVVGNTGVNLRSEPFRDAVNIGLVRSQSTVVLLGERDGGYAEVRVKRVDFSGPVQLTKLPPLPWSFEPGLPGDGGIPVAYLGWIETRHLNVTGAYAEMTNRYGTTFRPKPAHTTRSIGLVKGYATVSLAGQAEGDFTPVLVLHEDLLNPAHPMPIVQEPNPFPAPIREQMPSPPQDTTPGWVLTVDIEKRRLRQRTGRFGGVLRAHPHRSAVVIARIEPFAQVIVFGKPRGEYTPVRVDVQALKWAENLRAGSDLLSAEPLPTTITPHSTQPAPTSARQLPGTGRITLPDPIPEPVVASQARIGLHASTDPTISDAEIKLFQQLRPGVIKLLSFHPPAAIERLVENHPTANWVVRAFLEFGGRAVTPSQFVEWTLSDVKRTLAVLGKKPAIIELHNEPNLYAEGLGEAWSDGARFAEWWLAVHKKYRAELPDVPLMFPGLSPGGSVHGVRIDHIQFVEAARKAVEASDAVGVHAYWARNFPMQKALQVIDDFATRFPFRPIWVTEASNNDKAVPMSQKAQEYLAFWQALQSRGRVQGITFFAASASNPDFAHEVWLGNNIASIIGAR